MDGPLLATKLHPPTSRPTAIRRPRLTARLQDARRLVLVAAPAGFGKTTVVAQWLSAAHTKVAWVSLEGSENDGSQFWRYLLAAVDRAEPGAAATATALLSESAPVDAVLSALVNELDARETELTVVLDDYHAIERPELHAGVGFLVDHLPPRVRVVLTTRLDPPLPLGRLRAQGDLTELRAADLRFTPEEAVDYLNGAMGLTLSADDVARLGNRTEGWIAALQLAALSMQGRDDPGGFIDGFAGDDRYIVDYLVEEVLQRQSADVRDFLLQTSILGRLRGDLCDAVTGAGGGAATLAALDRSNLLVVPLDDQREWYRYHHLFAEMLRARLRDEQPDAVAGLHLRASEWFEAHDQLADAIGHAIEAGAFERAAGLIKRAAPGMQQRRQELTLAAWLEQLPDELSDRDPELALLHAGVLLSAGRTDGVDRLLARAEAVIGEPSPAVLALRRGVALYGAARALAEGTNDVAIERSEEAVRLAQDGSALDRGSAYGIRGLIRWAAGDLETARLSWERSLAELERAGHVSDALGGSIALGEILIAQGRLSDAEALYRRGLTLGTASSPPLRGTADMHVALADVLRERGDLGGARQHLASAEALGEYAGLPQNRHRRRMASARLLQAEGDPAAGVPLLVEAEQLYTPDFFPEVRPIPALRARLELAAGRVAQARAWARGRSAPDAGEVTFLGEYDAITLARIMLADGAVAELPTAIALLDRLLDAAESGGRDAAVIELLVLRALARHRAGSSESALSDLERATVLAEPEGWVRVFADEGPPLARLLVTLEQQERGVGLRRLRAEQRSPARGTRDLADPLSERELEVLRLLASQLSGPEIARHLVVSLNTLRTHTKHIYAKLGATSRRQAVARATELGLLHSPR